MLSHIILYGSVSPGLYYNHTSEDHQQFLVALALKKLYSRNFVLAAVFLHLHIFIE